MDKCYANVDPSGNGRSRIRLEGQSPLFQGSRQFAEWDRRTEGKPIQSFASLPIEGNQQALEVHSSLHVEMSQEKEKGRAGTELTMLGQDNELLSEAEVHLEENSAIKSEERIKSDPFFIVLITMVKSTDPNQRNTIPTG
jgi:hypothetical protein